MALQIIPLVPSIGSYRFTCSLAYNSTNTQHVLELAWNERVSLWFLNVLQADDTPIVMNQALVLGAFIGRWSQHPMFQFGALYAYDMSGREQDAGLNDLGTRVLLVYATQEDLVAAATQ